VLGAFDIELDVAGFPFGEDLIERSDVDRVGSRSNARANGSRRIETNRATLEACGVGFDAHRPHARSAPRLDPIQKRSPASCIRLDRDDPLELAFSCREELFDRVARERATVHIDLMGERPDQVTWEVGFGRRSRWRDRVIVEQETPTDLGTILSRGLLIGPDRGGCNDFEGGFC